MFENRRELGRAGLRALAAACALTVTLVGKAPAEPIDAAAKLAVWQVDSLVKVFEDDQPPAKSQPLLLEAARNEVVSAQFAVRASRDLKGLTCQVSPLLGPAGARIDPAQVRFVGYVLVKKRKYSPPYVLRKAPARFPDPLLEDKKRDVPKRTTQPVWITTRVPKKAKPGKYTGHVVFVAPGGAKETGAISLQVFPATLPDARTLQVYMWSNAWERRVAGQRLDAGPPTNERYWEVLRTYVRNMVAHRLTVVITPWLSGKAFPNFWGLIEVKKSDKAELVFDYTYFDRFYRICKAEGIDLVAGGMLASGRFGRTGHRSPVWKVEDGSLRKKKVLCLSKENDEFLAKFLPALQAHLEKRGWLDSYVQHVFDEPRVSNQDEYKQLAAIVKKYAPKVRRLDAIHWLAPLEIAGSVDIWIPQIQFYQQKLDSYKKLQKRGEEVWYYVTGFSSRPRRPCLNRLIDYPMLKTRLQHWFNFKSGTTGYLHWGWNFWPASFGKSFDVAGSFARFPGDAYIVYPKQDGVLDSIRYEAELEGIQDYELFKLLEKSRPEKAKAIVDTIVTDATEYSLDIPKFRAARRELLKALSEQLSKTKAEPDKPGWELTFHDEFDGDKLNKKLWRVSTKWDFTINREKQAYTDDALTFKDGVLHIKIEKRKARYVVERKDGTLKKCHEMEYASGAISTWDRFTQAYGWFEIRCKMPKARGTWPAFWIKPEQRGIKPPGAEIDIMEYLGKWRDKYQAALHWGDYGKGHKRWGSGDIKVPRICDEFHTYAVEWEPGKLTFYADGKPVAEKAGAGVPSAPLHMILNCALGGWGGRIDDSALPDVFQVDYVRVYRKKQ